MLRIVGVSDNKYQVLDTDDNSIELATAEELVLSLSYGVEIEGCKYGVKGLIVWYDGVEPFDVDVEVWKPIVYNGIPKGCYEVSNLGRVKSLSRYVKCSNYCKLLNERILRPRQLKGYFNVNLSCNAYRVNVLIHRLVALAFIPTVDNTLTVNHKDECKTNNSAYNLEWLSLVENLRYGTGHQRSALAQMKAVRGYRLDGSYIEFNSVKDAEVAVGVSNHAVGACCLRQNGHPTCAGYAWRFVDDDELAGRIDLIKEVFRRCKNRAVNCYNSDGSFLMTFLSVADVSIKFGVSKSTIYDWLHKRRKTCCGYIFRYADDDEFAEKAGVVNG